MILGIDIDGVLADFNKAYVPLIREISGRDLFPPDILDTIPCWDYPQHYGYTEAEVSASWTRIKTDKGFWLDLDPYKDNCTTLHGHWFNKPDDTDYYFITSRPGATAKQQTEDWVRYHALVQRPTVLVVKHPSEKVHFVKALGIDALIDDKLETAVANMPLCRSYLLDRTWNRANRPADLQVVDTMAEFFAREAAHAQS